MSEGVREPGHLSGPFLDEFHLAICVPSFSQWHVGFAMSLLNLTQMMHVKPVGRSQSYDVFNVQSALVEWSREELVKKALANEDPRYTHILFLDSDMVFPGETAHWLAYRRKPIVMANYVRRTVPAVPVTKSLKNQPLPTTDKSTGLEPVFCGGLGVALFEREVFNKVPRPWFKNVWRESDATPGKLLIDSEDVLFNIACQEEGYEVLVDHDLSKHVKHIGTFEYTNAMADPVDWGASHAVAS